MAGAFKAEVLVVGAGVAGLTVVRQLQRQSIPAIILEQSAYVGGRMQPSKKRATCESGAEFIHGHHRAIHELIEQAHLDVEDYLMDGGEGRFFRFNNNVFAQSSDFAKQVEYQYELLHSHAGADVSVEELAAHLKVENHGPGFFARGRVIRLEGTELSNISAQSLQQAMKNVGNSDRNYRIRGGFARLIAWLSENAPIVCNAKVARIYWKDKDIAVLTSDGTSFVCKKLIIAIPIDSLQLLTPEFIPMLPPEHSNAIKALRMGTAAKVLIHVKRASWPNFSAYATNDVVQVWWNHSHARGQCLVGFTAGAAVDKIATSSEADLLSQALSDIHRIGGRLDREDVLGVEKHVWNRPGRMAYSYVPVGALQARNVLHRCIEDRIWFCGEAVAMAGLAGTVGGAVQSAFNVVDAIASRYDQKPERSMPMAFF